jgi:hypothetical protein
MVGRRGALTLLGTALPAATAVLALPLRAELAPANLAAILVGVVALAGTLGAAPTPVLAGASGALAFSVLWSEPYGSIEVQHPGDRISGAVVFLVGTGLAVFGRRRQRHRTWRRRPWPSLRRRPRHAHVQAEHLGRVAAEIADGDTGGLVVLDVARSLVDVLRLGDCRFEVPPFDVDPAEPQVVLRRTGELELRGIRWDPTRIGLPATGFCIPVVARGHTEGRYICLPRRPWRPADEQVGIALALADQAASALLLDAVA